MSQDVVENGKPVQFRRCPRNGSRDKSASTKPLFRKGWEGDATEKRRFSLESPETGLEAIPASRWAMGCVAWDKASGSGLLQQKINPSPSPAPCPSPHAAGPLAFNHAGVHGEY